MSKRQIKDPKRKRTAKEWIEWVAKAAAGLTENDRFEWKEALEITTAMAMLFERGGGSFDRDELEAELLARKKDLASLVRSLSINVAMMAPVERIDVDLTSHETKVYLEPHCNVDMDGCIRYVESIDPEVQNIYTHAGGKPDTSYFCDGLDVWHAELSS